MRYLACAVILAGIVANPAAAQDMCFTALSGKPLSPSAAYKKIAATHPQKGEYETTDAFNARMAAAGLGPILVSVPLSIEAGKYDADRGILTFGKADLEFTASMFQDPDSIVYLYGLKESLLKKRGNAVGQNAFGAVARISLEQSDDYYFEIGQEVPGITLSIQMPPDRAKAVRPFLNLAVLGTPTGRLDKSSHYSAATIDAPSEEFGDDYYLYDSAQCIGIVDRRSNQVLASYSLTPAILLPDSLIPKPVGKLAMPPYPEISRRLGEHGLTILKITVSESGDIDGVSVAHSSGSDRLDQAAADFAKSNWHFTPTISGGVPKSGSTIEQVDWDALR